MSTQPAGTGMLGRHPHSLDVRAVNSVAINSDELDHRYALPFHVRTVQVEANLVAEPRLVPGGQIVAGRFDVPHRSLARMAFQVKRDSILLARFGHRFESLHQEL